MNDGNVYLEGYAKQLTLLQEAHFSFSGYFTRSTPRLGLVATWETRGTVSVSAKRKSFHCTRASTLTRARDYKTPEYLGVREDLVTPDTLLNVTVLSDAADSPKKRFSVESKTKISDDEWAKEMGRHELGILLGYVPFEDDGKSLLAVSRVAPSELLTDRAFDSKSLSGFLVKNEGIEIRAMFDPLVDPLIKHLQMSRSSEANKVGGLVKAVLTVLDVRYAESKPSSIKLKITLERAGGITKRSDLPKLPGVSRVESIEIEPQTWSYNYEITDIRYRDDRGDWFALDHSIPNESPATLDGDYNSPCVWRNGKVHKIGIDDIELLLPRDEPENGATGVRVEAADESREATAPLADQLANAVRSVRSCGMHCLVILESNGPSRIVNLNHPYLLAYLPLVLNQEGIKSNASTLETLEWPRPQPGEVVLVAIDGDAKMLGTQRLKFDNADDAKTLASAFLKRHSPPVRDARALLAAARAEARRTDRKVCLVVSGVRCGPCFRLARWMDAQHALLEKDYVILKVMTELESHAQEVFDTLNRPREAGVPWFAITDAEGKVLMTSDGPMGNIGMPMSSEDIRHMREMLAKTANRLTGDEIDKLIKSLVDFK